MSVFKKYMLNGMLKEASDIVDNNAPVTMSTTTDPAQIKANLNKQKGGSTFIPASDLDGNHSNDTVLKVKQNGDVAGAINMAKQSHGKMNVEIEKDNNDSNDTSLGESIIFTKSELRKLL